MSSDEKKKQCEKQPVTLTDQELLEGEPCDNCGKFHEKEYIRGDIEDMVKKHTRRYRMLIAGYFASIVLGMSGTYLTFGLGGPIMSVAAFGIFFFHTNMGFAAGGVDQLKQAVHMFDLKEAAEEAKSDDKRPGSGLYL